jgi:hypothetical protein
MRRVRLWLAGFCVLVASAGACGGDPPDKEMQQAQGAIDAARTAGAERYATDELMAAQDALAHAREAVEQRDYRLALSFALDSRERAQNAAKEATERKAAAREEADRAMSAAQAALGGARNRLKIAEASRVPARALAEPRATIADAEHRVQEARTAFDHGDYAAVLPAASSVMSNLARTTRDLEALAAPAARRHR